MIKKLKVLTKSFNKNILIKTLLMVLSLMLIVPTFNRNDVKFVNAMPNYRSMCVLEANTGTILNEYNMDMELAMASTTKIITAIVAIEHIEDFNKIITVADKAVGIEGTSIYLRKDEQISFDNLLYGLILASGNDAAMALACEIGGSEENFVNMMNEFVKSLNLTHTNLVNPHGLDAKGHYTSSGDLAKITAYALNNEKFKEVVSTKTKSFGNDEKTMRFLKNKNKLLFSQEGNIGVKTGFTDNAGRCLVNACDVNGMRIVSVVFNCGPMFEECEKLTNIAVATYKLKDFVLPYNFVGIIPVVNGDKTEISAATIKGFSKVIKIAEEDNYKVEYDLIESLEAPVDTQSVVGSVKVLYNNEEIYSDNLFSIDETKNINLKYMLNNIIENWFN